jgi:hypothetical protein
MSMQEDLANPSHPLNHIIRLGRSRARWRLFAVALTAFCVGLAVSHVMPSALRPQSSLGPG